MGDEERYPKMEELMKAMRELCCQQHDCEKCAFADFCYHGNEPRVWLRKEKT